MILQELIDAMINDIMSYCEHATQDIVADLQEKRFQNQGAFNGNPRWEDNAPDVIRDKGRNQPLVDLGNLRKELTTAKNWNLQPIKTKNSLTLNVPDTEEFTDSKYDRLQNGGFSPPYKSPRGNYMVERELPARNFKNISNQDMQWIKDQLVLSLKAKYE